MTDLGWVDGPFIRLTLLWPRSTITILSKAAHRTPPALPALKNHNPPHTGGRPPIGKGEGGAGGRSTCKGRNKLDISRWFFTSSCTSVETCPSPLLLPPLWFYAAQVGAETKAWSVHHSTNYLISSLNFVPLHSTQLFNTPFFVFDYSSNDYFSFSSSPFSFVFCLFLQFSKFQSPISLQFSSLIYKTRTGKRILIWWNLYSAHSHTKSSRFCYS